MTGKKVPADSTPHLLYGQGCGKGWLMRRPAKKSGEVFYCWRRGGKLRGGPRNHHRNMRAGGKGTGGEMLGHLHCNFRENISEERASGVEKTV